MTYGEARDAALYLIHQESIAGTEIPGTYNNQQDYLNRIPSLINAAQMDIATTAKKIPAVAMLGDMTCNEKYGAYLYTLPFNLYQRRGSGLLVPTPDGKYARFNQVLNVDRDQLLLREKLPDGTMLEYYRYPHRIMPDTEDDEQLDNVPEAQEAVPYYVAAHLVLQDDAFRYATLYNEYNAKKDGMTEPVTTEPGIVQDNYYTFADSYNFWG